MMKDKIQEIREMFNHHGDAYPKEEGIYISHELIERINCFWFRKDNNQKSGQLIIYLHGGAFSLGGIVSHAPLVSHFAGKFSIPVLFIDYSLAPENPFPTAINEVLKVYQTLLLKHASSEIIFMGDSAGGGLAISVLSKINENKLPIPKCLVMISPWADLTCSYTSHQFNAEHDPVFGGKKILLQEMASLYAGSSNVKEVSPIETVIHLFPPTLILAGSTEVLLDDSKAVYEKIKRQQTNTKLSIYKNQKHVWPLENIHTVESQKALIEIQKFITRE